MEGSSFTKSSFQKSSLDKKNFQTTSFEEKSFNSSSFEESSFQKSSFDEKCFDESSFPTELAKLEKSSLSTEPSAWHFALRELEARAFDKAASSLEETSFQSKLLPQRRQLPYELVPRGSAKSRELVFQLDLH